MKLQVGVIPYLVVVLTLQGLCVFVSSSLHNEGEQVRYVEHPRAAKHFELQEMFSTSMVSEVDDEGHYLSSADAELLSEPLPSHRSLLADYSPVANRRTPSPGRKLLQDYSPTPNQRSLPSPPNKRKLLSFVYEIDNQQSRQLLPNTFRKLLQDYGPMANRRSPSTHRKLLQAHMNMD